MKLPDIFFRKKVGDTPPTPPWMYWLLGAFFLYSAFHYNDKGTEEKPNELRQAVEKAGETVSKETITATYEDFKKLLFPAYSAALNIKDLKEGEGMPAVCGQEVTIAYTTNIVAGEEVDDNASKDAPKTFRIGDNDIIPALEQGVTGMRPGGTREIIATLAMSYGIKKFAHDNDQFPPNARIQYQVEMISTSPPLPDIANNPFRIANIVEPARGLPVLCGEEVVMHVTVWATDGKKLYSTHDGENKPIRFTPGKSEVFLGLEQGIIGMTRGGGRTLVVPPAFQKTMRGNEPSVTFPFPEAQTVLVDVEAIP